MMEGFSLHAPEIFLRQRVSSRPAAFDEIKADFIEPVANPDFIFQRQIDVFPLGPVPQCRVVQRDVSSHAKWKFLEKGGDGAPQFVAWVGEFNLPSITANLVS